MSASNGDAQDVKETRKPPIPYVKVDNIMEMPAEILLMPFRYLDFKEKIKISRVNRQWYKLAEDLMLEEKRLSYQVFSWPRHKPLTEVSEGLQMQGRLKWLSKMKNLEYFEVPDGMEFRLTKELAEYCPKIKTIKCKSLQMVWQYCHNMFMHNNPLSLELIELTASDAFDAELLIRILANNNRIQYSASSQSLQPTFASHSNKLRSNPHSSLIYTRLVKLNLASGMHARDFNHLKDFTNLKCLEMVTNFDRQLLAACLRNVLNLEELSVKTSIENFDLFIPLDKLTVLNFTDASHEQPFSQPTTTPVDTTTVNQFLESRGHQLTSLTIFCKKQRWFDTSNGPLLRLIMRYCPIGQLNFIKIYNLEQQGLRIEWSQETRKLLLTHYPCTSLEPVLDYWPTARDLHIEGSRVLATPYNFLTELRQFARSNKSVKYTAFIKIGNGASVRKWTSEPWNLECTIAADSHNQEWNEISKLTPEQLKVDLDKLIPD